jgi:Flp pilus assembly protein TadG
MAARWRALTANGDRGSATLDVVLWVPALMGVLMFLVLCGRLVSAHLALDAAAHDAARAASLARTTTAAQAQARQAAQATLADRGVTCPQPQVTVDTDGLRPGGVVTVTVSCAVPLSDLTLIAVPGTRTVSATAVSPIDEWRGGPST